MRRYYTTPFFSLSSTKNVLRFVVLCLQVLRLCSSAEIAVIGVLTEVTNPTKCEQIIPTVVYEIESLRWMVTLFNLNNYTHDIKLEIDVVDICEADSSVMRTIELIRKYKTGPKKLIGILGMTISANMLNVSWFLSSLPAKDRIIQIGTSETARTLNDRSRYPTFFRVIEDDEYQFQLIAKLLKQLKWNYIAILHEKDVYGEEGAEILIQYLPDLGITLAVKLGIDNIDEQLFILTSDYSNVQGVVIIAQPWTLDRVSKNRLSRYRFILTESVLLDDSFSNLEPFEHSFAILRPQISFPSLEKHWEKLFNADNITDNAIFRLMIEQHAGCPDALHPTCNLTKAAGKLSKMIHTTSVLPKLIGIYTFASLLRQKYVRCVESHCQLSALKLEDIQKKTINLSYLSGILSLPSINLTGRFNEEGNLDFSGGLETYQVYNNMPSYNPGHFVFEQVGEYNGTTLKLNMAALKNLEMWGGCPKGKNCRTCSKGFPQFIYKEGDIMLFGIAPIRASNDARTCPCSGELSSSKLKGSQLAEAMFYAVETLNQGKLYKNLFPGKKIGIVIMDSCNQQIPTFEAMLSFIHGTASICQEILSCPNIIAKTHVYIGGLTSEVSLRISPLMSALRTVQISYASTSSVFRDPMSLEHPNFIRLTPSDTLRIEAMIDICVKMRWRYASLIYVDDAYGRPAQRELISKANVSGLCVTQSLPFTKGDDPNDFLRKLKRRPDAKVVIVFLNYANLETFMTSLVENMKEREFTFLGSESWGRSLKIDKAGRKILGSLSLRIDIPPDPGFDDYLKRTGPSIAKSKPWSLAAMESQCYMPLSLNKRSSKPCPVNLTLSQLQKQHRWAPMVIQAVYAAAIGLNMSVNRICKTVDVCQDLFEKFQEVIEIFKKVKLKGPDGKYERVFDENGDGTRPYIVYQIQQKGKEFIDIKIGIWSQSSGLVLNNKEIDVPSSNCPNQKRCSECPVARIDEVSRKNYISALIGFIILLLILLVIIILFCMWHRFGSDRNDLGTRSPTVVSYENNIRTEAVPEYASIEESRHNQLTGEMESETRPKVLGSWNWTTENPAYEGFISNRNDLGKDDDFADEASAVSYEDNTRMVAVSENAAIVETHHDQLAREIELETRPKVLGSWNSITPNPSYEGFRRRRQNSEDANYFGSQDNIDDQSALGQTKRESNKNMNWSIQNDEARSEHNEAEQTRRKTLATEHDSDTYLRVLSPRSLATIYPESEEDA